MKKILFLFALLAALQIQKPANAQLQSDTIVEFTANLNGMFHLYILDGGQQIANFNTADDYNNGVIEGTGITPGFTTIALDATGNWYLNISAPDFAPVSGTGIIPIENLGVYCEATGTHQFGVEVSCNNTTAATAMGVTNTDQVLINLLTDNTGGQADNTFILHWLMGTMQGSMNSTSMLTQLANNDFSLGQYETSVTLTMTEIP